METTLSLQVAREVDSKHVIIIMGAVPAGIAIAACLNLLSTPNIVLEREDCIASLWKKKSYDRLKLHLAKKYCTLPHMTFPSHFPKFVSKYMFIQYLDNYVARFNVNPLCSWSVEWQVVVWNAWSSETQEFEGRFLVVVTDESSEGSKGVGVREFLRESCTFKCEYDNGNRCSGKDVLVVGCANSCTENAYDLCNFGAQAAISVRSPVYFFPLYLHNVHFMW